MREDVKSMWRGTTTTELVIEEKNISNISDKQRKRFDKQIKE